MKELKIGVIGPTNLVKLAMLMGKPRGFFTNKAIEIGKIIAVADYELWVNSDAGMLVAVAQAYKKAKGRRLVVLYPIKPEPWPIEHAKPYAEQADLLRNEPNWFWANYNVVSLVDVCVCVGLSAGTYSELAYIKWNRQFGCGNLKQLVAVRELLNGGMIPPEIEVEVTDILTYVENPKDLKEILDDFASRTASQFFQQYFPEGSSAPC